MAYDEVGDCRISGELQWRMSDSLKPGDKSLYILHLRIYSCICVTYVATEPRLCKLELTCLFFLGFIY